MAKVLVVTYSQSGQLDEIVSNVVSLLAGRVELVLEQLKPIPDFPFPWKGIDFYDVMPESVEMIPSALAPFNFNPEDHFDL
ncbi:MAG: dialkylrecorsinol condensing enzyme, partial [Bacteroidetes bacterium CG_4_9_14_3_um_filter_41_19]